MMVEGMNYCGLDHPDLWWSFEGKNDPACPCCRERSIREITETELADAKSTIRLQFVELNEITGKLRDVREQLDKLAQRYARLIARLPE